MLTSHARIMRGVETKFLLKVLLWTVQEASFLL